MSKVTKSSSATGKWAKHMGLGTKRSTSIDLNVPGGTPWGGTGTVSCRGSRGRGRGGGVDKCRHISLKFTVSK